MNERPKTYRVVCPCDYEEWFASEAAAKAVRDDHAERCVNTPELEDRS